jgi:uncharacterized protein (TIGR00369 family)
VPEKHDSRSLTVTWEQPQPRNGQGELTGRQYVEAVIAGRIPPSPMSQLMGFRFTEVGDGFIVVECTPGEQHYNMLGNGAHGGLACTLMDTVTGTAIQSSLPAGSVGTTLELKTNMVRPITAQTGKLRCEGKLLHRGRRVATSEGRILDAAGKLYAHGTTTMLVVELQPKPPVAK